jgi:hypothetical protein
MNGNIIANAGFVDQFATRTDSAGAKVLAPGILSAWGGAMTVGQTCGFLFFPPYVHARALLSKKLSRTDGPCVRQSHGKVWAQVHHVWVLVHFGNQCYCRVVGSFMARLGESKLSWSVELIYIHAFHVLSQLVAKFLAGLGVGTMREYL